MLAGLFNLGVIATMALENIALQAFQDFLFQRVCRFPSQWRFQPARGPIYADTTCSQTDDAGLVLHNGLFKRPSIGCYFIKGCRKSVQTMVVQSARRAANCVGFGVCSGVWVRVWAGEQRPAAPLGNGHGEGQPGPGRKILTQDDPGHGPV